MDNTTVSAQAFDEENLNYLRGLLGKEKVCNFLSFDETSEIDSQKETDYRLVLKCLNKMEAYGENKWWMSDDKKVLAYYQVQEKCLLMEFRKFHESLEFLLGRPVWTHEFGLNPEGLKEEAKRAFNGNQDSVKTKEKTIKDSFSQLADLGTIIGVISVNTDTIM